MSYCFFSFLLVLLFGYVLANWKELAKKENFYCVEKVRWEERCEYYDYDRCMPFWTKEKKEKTEECQKMIKRHSECTTYDCQKVSGERKRSKIFCKIFLSFPLFFSL